MIMIDSYTNKPDLSGQVFAYELHHKDGRWSVTCWKLPEDPRDEHELEWTHMWEVSGNRQDNPATAYGVDPIWVPFDEAAARQEFERWRDR